MAGLRKKTAQINVKLRPGVREAALAAAHAHGRNLSEVVEAYLLRFIKATNQRLRNDAA